MLQDIMMSKLINGTSLGQKIKNSDSVSDKGQYALDATEKNPNIEDSLAGKILGVSNNIAKINATVDSIVALPDGESTAADAEIAAAKVGPKGENYTTLQESITTQISNSKCVSVSNTAPSADSDIPVWLNTESLDKDGINIPQINDSELSLVDTWSSLKIRAMITSLVKGAYDDSGNNIIISEILDDTSSSDISTWSSDKINSVINDKINEFASTVTDDGTINTYAEALNWIASHGADYTALLGSVENKVEKEDGKGLSTEDFTTELKNKTVSLNESLSAGAEGQFAVSDGKGGIKWVTIDNADSIQF